MDLKRQFGRHIRKLREMNRMTQEQLAEAVGLSAVSVSNIERGAHAPAFRRLRRFAKALYVDLPDLFRFDDQ